MASATIANPGELARRLTGEPVEEITESGAPTGDKVFVCYNPPVVNRELGSARRIWARRRSSRRGSSGRRSRRSSGLRAGYRGPVDGDQERRRRQDGGQGIVRGYRGYLPMRRRRGREGPARARCSGSSRPTRLELGVDIGHLDVAVLAGYPGGIASPGSRPGAPVGAAAGRRPCSWRRARRWTSSWSRTPSTSSARRPSTPA